MNFEYVQETYGVPACLNRCVEVDGQPGIIIKDCGHHIGVNFDSDKPGVVSHCHPTWKVKYLGIGEPRKLTRSQQRYRDYLDSPYYEAGDSFAFYLGVKGAV
ncbi:hypothetical protein [Catenovulum sediminis]|uniref:Uncharacterized protein n=1 Tax=Catenovulum sediminis TaxID=1740262 RepID=A0ABV1RHD9_9ALTE